MKDDGLDETDFANVSHKVLEKIKGDGLKIFIIARKQDIPKSNLPKKGKLDNAIKGEKNLISLDFECRKMKCIADEKFREAIDEELDSEEDDLILFSLKIHLEGNNQTVKDSTLFEIIYRIKKVCQDSVYCRSYMKYKEFMTTKNKSRLLTEIDSFSYFSSFFLFFWSGLQCPKAYSLWGGVVPSPSIG